MKRLNKQARRSRIRPIVPADLGEVSGGMPHDMEAARGGSEVTTPIMLIGTRTLIYPIYPNGG